MELVRIALGIRVDYSMNLFHKNNLNIFNSITMSSYWFIANRISKLTTKTISVFVNCAKYNREPIIHVRTFM